MVEESKVEVGCVHIVMYSVAYLTQVRDACVHIHFQLKQQFLSVDTTI
jgi:hypothetical protein